MKLSKCGNFLAVVSSMVGEDGADEEDVRNVLLKDLKSDTMRVVDGVKGAMSVEWTEQGNMLFTLPDAIGRPGKVMITKVVRDSQLVCGLCPQTVHVDANPECFVSLQRTKDWKYVCINSNSKNSSEVRGLDMLQVMYLPDPWECTSSVGMCPAKKGVCTFVLFPWV